MLLVFDTCTEWVEAFPTQTERPQEGSKHPLKEIAPGFGLPRSFRGDSGPPSTPHITQGNRSPGDTLYAPHGGLRALAR